MPKYIDCELAKEALTGWDTEPTDEEIEYTLDNIPPADVAEVQNGEWIKTDNIPNKEHILVKCSLCHSGHYLKKFLNDGNGEQTYKHHCETIHFCSSCGADMRGEKDAK